MKYAQCTGQHNIKYRVKTDSFSAISHHLSHVTNNKWEKSLGSFHKIKISKNCKYLQHQHKISKHKFRRNREENPVNFSHFAGDFKND